MLAEIMTNTILLHIYPLLAKQSGQSQISVAHISRGSASFSPLYSPALLFSQSSLQPTSSQLPRNLATTTTTAAASAPTDVAHHTSFYMMQVSEISSLVVRAFKDDYPDAIGREFCWH